MTDVDPARLHELREQGREWAEVGAPFGLNADQARLRVTRWRKRKGIDKSADSDEQVIYRESAKGAVAESNRASRIRTLEQLSERWEVDLSQWYIDRHVINKWEVGAGDGDGGLTVEELYQVKAWLKPASPYTSVLQAIEEQLDEMRGYAPVYKRPAYSQVTDPHMFEACLFDHHLGMLAWSEETGADYDSEIAEDLAVAAAEAMLSRVQGYEVDKILLPLGNDWIHADGTIDGSGGITNKGTSLDVDTRWQKLFRSARRVSVRLIDTFRAVAPVEVVVIPGNHDTERTFYLGDSLESWYRNDEAVEVRNDPRPRKYVAYGDNLIGFTHGHREKPKDLPVIMATEVPELWAKATVRQ